MRFASVRKLFMEKINIEVAYALPDTQRIIALQVTPGCTAYEAAEQSGIVKAFPQINLAEADMGIFGKTITDPASHVVKEGDRVEIYRPLIIDPKEVRRARAAKTKTTKAQAKNEENK